MSGIGLSISLCAVALVWLTTLLRRDRFSLGLPIAYLIGLLLIHVPGAFAQLMTDALDYDANAVEVGIHFTAIGSICFVGGVNVARLVNKKRLIGFYSYSERFEFWYFCLIGGLFVQFGLGFLYSLPSVRSALDKGSALWMLGTLLALRFAISRGKVLMIAIWSAFILIQPVMTLLMSGFLSYGSAAVIIVLSTLVVSVQSRLKLVTAGSLAVFVGLTIFVNYFAHRDEFREVAWSAASMGERIRAATEMFSDFQWFDPTDDMQLTALDKRLNQNYFVGLAAERIRGEQTNFLYGRSIWEGVTALVPRALWPEKPVFGGSGSIVTEMTGLPLNQDTSWGVGNVMEFQINFGTAGVVIGFLILGFLLGWLDCEATLADACGNTGKLILFFLVAVALIQPNGSIVELAGGSAAAVVSAFIWKWLWELYLARSGRRASSREFGSLR